MASGRALFFFPATEIILQKLTMRRYRRIPLNAVAPGLFRIGAESTSRSGATTAKTYECGFCYARLPLVAGYAAVRPRRERAPRHHVERAHVDLGGRIALAAQPFAQQRRGNAEQLREPLQAADRAQGKE